MNATPDPEQESGEVILTEGPYAARRARVVGSYTSPEGRVLLTIELDGMKMPVLQSKTQRVSGEESKQ